MTSASVPAQRLPDEIERLARERFGVGYLYPIQRFVVSNVLEGNHQIVVLPTGSGKSLCFLLPSLALNGPTLVVVPLLSLLADQERKLRALGIPMGVLRGGLPPEEKSRLWKDLEGGSLKLLLATLESCLAPPNLAALRRCGVRHLVVDEAHCISEWGDSFRPAYLQAGSLARALAPKTVSAFTATASREVIDRIRGCLFTDGEVRIVGENADRPGISYSVEKVLCPGRALSRLIRQAERPLLVFCRTRNDTELASRAARRACGNRSAFFYHAGLTREERAEVEAWFLASRDGVLFATCAYGMGVDKPDVRTVIHAQVPSSVEAYLQESGRAGRDGRPSRAILLFDPPAERAHLGRLPDERSRLRFDRMLGYAMGTGSCRRNALLSLIGQEPVACAGCDVCDGHASDLAEGESAIVSFVQRHRRRFVPAEAAEVLGGAAGPRAERELLDCLSGAGALSGWTASQAEDAIRSLLGQHRLRLAGRGPWKGRLTVTKAP
jgi:ATP-dependent DNA helicase RecQ